MSDTNTPRHQILTRDQIPAFFSCFFGCVENGYSRRRRYIDDFNRMFREVRRLSMSGNYTPYIDSSGHILYRFPEQQ